jgi:hypothetical protein
MRVRDVAPGASAAATSEATTGPDDDVSEHPQPGPGQLIFLVAALQCRPSPMSHPNPT